jgi:hypothetical protein
VGIRELEWSVQPLYLRGRGEEVKGKEGKRKEGKGVN